jgi:hypothetical protein
MWPGIKYAMYSFKSLSDRITFIPRRVEARLYIWITLILIGTNRHAKKSFYSRFQNA